MALAHDLRNLAMQLLLRLDVMSASRGLPESAIADVTALRAGVVRLQAIASDLQAASVDRRDPGHAALGETPSAATPFTVLVIDDNLLLVEALERRLALVAGFVRLYREDELEGVVEASRRLRPTVILLDVNLPGGRDAMALLQDLVTHAPDTSVIMFTGSAGAGLVTRSMALGARGFAAKGITPDRLMDTIRRVVAGEVVIALED